MPTEGPRSSVVVDLAYGDGSLPVTLPTTRTTVVRPTHRPAAPDAAAAVTAALRHPVAGPPLRELVRPGQRVAVSICDGTRPQPRDVVIPALLAELDGIVRLDDVVLLVATGTHRGNTPAELRAMLGSEVVDSVRVVNHDARAGDALTWCGRYGADVPVWLSREWVTADVRITTGFVEPHFFAGFSGGPKLVAPGLAALETVLTLHDAARIGDPRATWGVIDGNPVHDDVRAIAAGTGVDFSLDVVLNADKSIVAAFGGTCAEMHAAACSVVRATAMQPLPHRFDVVVTTNSGHPLDQNLYQAVKGISAAAQVVKPGGLIVSAAECRDGFPDHGPFRTMLEQASSPAELLAGIQGRTETVADQWQAQILAKVMGHARVVMHTGLESDDLAAAGIASTPDVSVAVAAELVARPDARICVLPEGPQTIVYVR